MNVCLPLTCSLLGTWSTTQACALTGNQTSDPLVTDQYSIHWATPGRVPCDFLFEPTVFINCQILDIFQVFFSCWFLIYFIQVHRKDTAWFQSVQLYWDLPCGPEHGLSWWMPMYTWKQNEYSALLELHECQLGQVFFFFYEYKELIKHSSNNKRNNPIKNG